MSLLRNTWRAALIAHAPALFVRLCRPDDRELGELGEELAARHLRRHGYRILGRRLRTEYGEVDLYVAHDGRRACVEVKAARASAVPMPRAARDTAQARDLRWQPSLRWRPGARCDARRLKRLAAIARSLADPASERGAGGEGRIDLIEVLVDFDRARVHIWHHPDLRRPLL